MILFLILPKIVACNGGSGVKNHLTITNMPFLFEDSPYYPHLQGAYSSIAKIPFAKGLFVEGKSDKLESVLKTRSWKNMSRQRKRYDRLASIAGLKMKRRRITQIFQILNIDGKFVFSS